MSTYGPEYDYMNRYFHDGNRQIRHPDLKMNRYGTYYREDEMYGSEAAQLLELRADEPDFPKKILTHLGKRAPETLTCYGDYSLLKTRIIMVCGARNASRDGTDLAFTCGRVIAKCGFTVLSGYARGVDLAAHSGALEAGGKTIAVVPYGLSRFRVHKDIQDSFDPNSFLVMSELPLWQVFTTYAAFRRNKLMVALADAVIVVEPGETGGTWYSAEKASEMGKGLYFLEGARPEIIPRLESLGGRRIAVVNGVPDLKEILNESH
jgi:DNA processing protein